jgi:hypothetical protein
MVAVTYEQERGLRDRYEKADGYVASASRTFAVPIAVLYRHWADEKLRKKWLRGRMVVRRSTAQKSMRIIWRDGTSVDVNFYSKGAKKGQAVVQHVKLAGAKDVGRTKKYWHDALDRLSGLLA